MRRGDGGRTWAGGLTLAGLALVGSGCGSPADGGPGKVPTAASAAATSAAATSAAATSAAATSAAPVPSAPAAATSPGAAPVAGPGPCDVLSGADVAAALGGSAADGHRLQPQTCVYPGTGGPPRLLVSLVPAEGSRLEQTAAPGFRQVTGLGEWAGWVPPAKTLTVLDQGRLLGLVYLGSDLDEAAARSALQGLARRALERW